MNKSPHSSQRLRFACPKCKKELVAPPVDHRILIGKSGNCVGCQTRVILPIPNPAELLGWARTTDWDDLWTFSKQGAAKGHRPETVDKLIRIYEQRRAMEMERDRLWMEANAGAANTGWTTFRNAARERSRQRLKNASKLAELQSMDNVAFEHLVAQVLNSQGLDASRVGGAYDGGVDVVVRDADGEQSIIVQCKRYAGNRRVGVGAIRDFIGAFSQSTAERGLIVTSSKFSGTAKVTAERLEWLTLVDGAKLVEWVIEILEAAEPTVRTTER